MTKEEREQMVKLEQLARNCGWCERCRSWIECKPDCTLRAERINQGHFDWVQKFDLARKALR